MLEMFGDLVDDSSSLVFPLTINHCFILPFFTFFTRWERRRRGPFWGWDPYFSDSDNYDDSGDSDASDDSYYFGRRRNRDDCEIM